MSTAKGDAAITTKQQSDVPNVNSDQAGATSKFFDSVYGAPAQKNQHPADGAATQTSGDTVNKNVTSAEGASTIVGAASEVVGSAASGDRTNKNVTPAEGASTVIGAASEVLGSAAPGDPTNKNVTPAERASTVIGAASEVLGSAASGDPKNKNVTPAEGSGDAPPKLPMGVGGVAAQWLRMGNSGELPRVLGGLPASGVEQGMPERLATGDTEIRENNRDIIVMPKDEGSLIINKDGTFDLQLNQNSKETADVTQKDGVTTITFTPSGDKIAFDKNGLLNIKRGSEDISWLRLDPLPWPPPGMQQQQPGPNAHAGKDGSGNQTPIKPPSHVLPGMGHIEGHK